MSSKVVNVILLLLAVQNICAAANDFADYYDTYYDPKTNSAAKGVAEISGGNVNKISFKGISCSCKNLACSCCAGIKIEKLHFNEEACAVLKYEAQSNVVKTALTLNQKEIVSTSLPVKTPPPLCVKIPHLPSVQLCLKFQQLTVVNHKLNICADMETHVPMVPTLILHFNCIKI